jgi:hypothetical protein
LNAWSNLGEQARAAAVRDIAERSLKLRSFNLTFGFLDFVQAHGMYMSEAVERAAMDAFGAVAASTHQGSDNRLQDKLDALRKMMREELSARV